MASRPCRLEAAEDAVSVLAAYDSVTGRWPFPPDARFWKAVEHAHSLGYRGAEHKVAIIDSGFDTSFAALQGRIDQQVQCVPLPLPGTPGANTNHGTAVLLLIASVAPECRFVLYSVQRESGAIDAADVAFALNQAASSDADIINVSLGAWQTVPDMDERLQHASDAVWNASLYSPSPKHGRNLMLLEILPHADCELCQAASAAVKSGKLLFAAAGNDATEIYCPARAEDALAAGFQTSEKRFVVAGPEGGKLEREGSAVGAQSLFVDLPLEEVPGVLGTSFASPLYAGVAALGVSTAEFSAYISALPLTQLASVTREQVQVEVSKLGHYTKEMTAPLQQASKMFFAAMQRLPHVHSEPEMKARKDRSDATLTNPAACMSCGFLAYPFYVSFGLFLLETGYYHDAKQLLEAARAIAPWSDAAAANLGRTLEQLGELSEAARHYEDACTIAPGVPPYEESRKRIRAKLAQQEKTNKAFRRSL
jgi:tetratricopeptide (TPR) repeat protein